VLSPMTFIQHAVPAMRERGFGRILSVSSSSAREPIPTLMLSTAHRTGMLGAFKLLARHLAPHGITLNTLLPGRIATARIAHLYGSIEAAQEAAPQEIPAGRLGTIEEIGAAGAFLCSAAASYITGQALAVDGGLIRAT
jgi:3-oxoacyl-[acyl-carrier protein] reductase